jgi:hypothetical protein
MKRTGSSSGVGTRALALGAGLAALAVTGCSHDYWVRFQLLTDAPVDAVVDRDEIELPLGYAVAVRALPMRDDEALSSDMTVDLQSRRPSTLGVDDGLREREFVIYGSELGATTVDVYFGDDYAGEISATVVPAASR